MWLPYCACARAGFASVLSIAEVNLHTKSRRSVVCVQCVHAADCAVSICSGKGGRARNRGVGGVTEESGGDGGAPPPAAPSGGTNAPATAPAPQPLAAAPPQQPSAPAVAV